MPSSYENINQIVSKLRYLKIQIFCQKVYEFGLEYCMIPKTGTIITQQILCDITKEYKGIPFKSKFSQKINFLKYESLIIFRNIEMRFSECKRNADYRNSSISTWKKPMKPKKLVIIREPIERFTSFYLHFCK